MFVEERAYISTLFCPNYLLSESTFVQQVFFLQILQSFYIKQHINWGENLSGLDFVTVQVSQQVKVISV